MGDDRLRRKKLIRQQLNWSDVLFKQIECTYIIQVVETGWNANANLTFIVKYFNEYIFIRFLLMNSIHFFFLFTEKVILYVVEPKFRLPLLNVKKSFRVKQWQICRTVNTPLYCMILFEAKQRQQNEERKNYKIVCR